MDRIAIDFTLNGRRTRCEVAPRLHVVDFLRESFALASPRIGCEHGVCGACTLRVDGVPVRGCLMLAVQLDGAQVETLEHLTDTGEIADLQAAFHTRNAVQCGYCTAGMLVTGAEMLRRGRPMTREEIRAFISGNYCRCTGYEAIVDALEGVLTDRFGPPA